MTSEQGPTDEFLIKFDYSPETPLSHNWVMKFGDVEFHPSKRPEGIEIKSVTPKNRMDYSVPTDFESAHRVYLNGEFRAGAIFFVEVQRYPL